MMEDKHPLAETESWQSHRPKPSMFDPLCGTPVMSMLKVINSALMVRASPGPPPAAAAPSI